MKINVIKLGRALLWVVYAWMAVTIVLLFLAFLLQLLGADQSAGFVEWVYRSTERAMAPFRGIFDSIALSDDSVFDVSILFAIIVYGFAAMAIHVGVDWLTGMLRHAEQERRHDELVAAQLAAAQPAPTSKVGHVVRLHGPDGVSATAVLTEHAGGTYADLTLVGLDPTRQYTVWSEADTGGRIDAGIFQPSSAGPTKVTVTSPIALVHTRLFGVAVSGLPGEAASTDVLAARLT
jgi:uncharacterized protein YggT (Ycf19 family)